MYILYLDESGNHAEASHFVLAGLAVFEREIHWFSQDLDSLQLEYLPEEIEPVHFHAARLRVRDGDKVEAPWEKLPREKRLELKDRVYDIIRGRRGVLFGCAVEKRYSALRREDPYERAFEDLISRFDLFMSRINRYAISENREEQRGLVVLAESSYEKTIAILARRLRETGTRWGQLRNVTEVPLFAPASATRLLQYADFCANAIYGRYHSKLTGDFDKIAGKFDQDSNILHGLAHLTTDPYCSCLACFSRRSRPPNLPPI
ncbi:MAG: DUF3800 domain-containing protein [Dehalococcoidia bacterium]|nr:DUF3800 domain-containing protein [Dehalococcoidia bacterium]